VQFVGLYKSHLVGKFGYSTICKLTCNGWVLRNPAVGGWARLCGLIQLMYIHSFTQLPGSHQSADITQALRSNMRGDIRDNYTEYVLGAVACQSVQRLATGWTVRGSNPDGALFSATVQPALGGPPSLLYIEYWVISGGKAAGAWRW